WCCRALSCPWLSSTAKPLSTAVYTILGFSPAAAATVRGLAPSFSTTRYAPSIASPSARSTGAGSVGRAEVVGSSEQAASAATATRASRVRVVLMVLLRTVGWLRPPARSGGRCRRATQRRRIREGRMVAGDPIPSSDTQTANNQRTRHAAAETAGDGKRRQGAGQMSAVQQAI